MRWGWRIVRSLYAYLRYLPEVQLISFTRIGCPLRFQTGPALAKRSGLPSDLGPLTAEDKEGNRRYRRVACPKAPCQRISRPE